MISIETIHMSLVNGQRRQMVEQIDEYESEFRSDYREYAPEFWSDYRDYLKEMYAAAGHTINDYGSYDYFSDAVISYHRIKAR